MLKKTLIALLMTAILLLPALTACNNTPAPEPEPEPAPTTTAPEPEPTATPAEPADSGQNEMEQLLADSVLALKDVQSYKARMDMTMVTETIGGENPTRIVMDMVSDIAFDMAAKQLHMTMNMVMQPEGSEGLPQQDVNMDMYMLDGWLYMMMDIPMLGTQWMKMAYDETLAEAYDLNMVEQQLILVGSPSAVELTGMETVDGEQCYALKVTPDMELLLQWAQQQQGSSGADIDPEAMATAADAFKQLTFIVWITEDSKLMKKMDMDMVMEISGADLDANTGFDKMVSTTSMVMNLYDYNQPVSIVLPPEAQNAQEMPGAMSGQ